jgi:hypothetical protein
MAYWRVVFVKRGLKWNWVGKARRKETQTPRCLEAETQLINAVPGGAELSPRYNLPMKELLPPMHSPLKNTIYNRFSLL